MVRSLDMHGHWINSIALSSDHVMRNSPPTESERMLSPGQRYAKATGGVEERMVSCSDDHTLCLWLPCSSKKPVARMTKDTFVPPKAAPSLEVRDPKH